MKKLICFDLDGTLADLYNVPNWLEYLRKYDPKPYEIAEPLWDMDELRSILQSLQADGWEIRVITWLSKESNAYFDYVSREAKKNWLAKYSFPLDGFHGVKYGATKANSIRRFKPDRAILIDDNVQVRNGWSMGETIDPTVTNILEALTALLDQFTKSSRKFHRNFLE